MKRTEYQHSTAHAGGGAPNVPFYEFVVPNLYVGDVVASLLTASAGKAADAFAALRRSYWERKTRTRLEGLDDRTLADIGVARSEIGAVAREAAMHPSFARPAGSRWMA